MTESHPLQSVIHNIIERYLGRYESVSVGIYRFHAINGGEFSKYLNSLKITLSRKAFIPTYCWHYDPYGERYILFLRSCCFFLLIFATSFRFNNVAFAAETIRIYIKTQN